MIYYQYGSKEKTCDDPQIHHVKQHTEPPVIVIAQQQSLIQPLPQYISAIETRTRISDDAA